MKDRSRTVLRAIHDYLQANGEYPTTRQLGKILGITNANEIMSHLWALRGEKLVAAPSDAPTSVRLIGVRVRVCFTEDEAGERLRRELEEM